MINYIIIGLCALYISYSTYVKLYDIAVGSTSKRTRWLRWLFWKPYRRNFITVAGRQDPIARYVMEIYLRLGPCKWDYINHGADINAQYINRELAFIHNNLKSYRRIKVPRRSISESIAYMQELKAWEIEQNKRQIEELKDYVKKQKPYAVPHKPFSSN